MLKNKFNKVNYFSCFVFVIFIFVLVGTFYDRQISEAVIDKKSIWAHLFEHYTVQGANVLYFSVFEMMTWIAWRRIQDKTLRWTVVIGMLLIDINQMFLITYDFVYYTAAVIQKHSLGVRWRECFDAVPLYDHSQELVFWLSTIILFIIFSFIFFWFISKQTEEQLRYSTKAAFIGLLVVVLAQVSIDGLKNWWGRYRPYEIGAQGTHYTPWYKINGDNGHSSFPSGHTRFSWLYLYLPLLLQRNQIKLQRIFTIVAIVFGIGGALGRVRTGIHFLTDVSVSSLITVTIIYLASRVMQVHFIEKK
ncbi:phosphatase PAP2 family protein [Fructobacillus durionis]|uniref:Membrane-associated phospholipid phosphatase n=1 Tax=Fructobacillus durionis TaxID=283737 RepID=A0A1I1E1B0_9LACO|nr:phosphatase PAP2 family protein [Fructobacillus durionis]SFB80985.1 Membrane-associated phospholipid phosphatase [Fructobacillus durionis]